MSASRPLDPAELDAVPLQRLDGRAATLADFAGQALLIVNVASRCGFTPQYDGLEALHRRWQARGFAVLGFPCNQFGQQEPGDAAEIASFCRLSHDVSFPMSAKLEVNGAGTDPLWAWMKRQRPPAASATVRAAATAAVMLPAAMMWFSLIRIASHRASRWLPPPPTRTANFWARRRPGRVFRVSTTWARVPATRSA